MKLKTLLILVGSVLLAFAGTWYYMAHEAEGELERFQKAAREEGVDIRFGDVSVGGFPYRITISVSELQVEARHGGNKARLRAPEAQIITQPWDLTHYILLFETAELAIADGPRIDLESARTSVVLAEGAPIRVSIDAGSGRYASEDGGFSFGRAELHTRAEQLPEGEISSSGLRETKTGEFLLRLADLEFGLGASTVLSRTAKRFEIEGSLRGARTPMPNREALAKWRDAGGTLELSTILMNRGDLSIAGDGSIALDRRFRLLGAVTLHANSATPIIRHYRAAGKLRRSDADSCVRPCD